MAVYFAYHADPLFTMENGCALLLGEPYSLEWERDPLHLTTRVTFVDFPVATRTFSDLDMQADPLVIENWLIETAEYWVANGGVPWKKH